VAHEAHHRGQLILASREMGHPLPKKVTDGLWWWQPPKRAAGRTTSKGNSGRKP